MTKQLKTRFRALPGSAMQRKRSRWSDIRTALLPRDTLETPFVVEDPQEDYCFQETSGEFAAARQRWGRTGTALVRRDAIAPNRSLGKRRILAAFAKLGTLAVVISIFPFFWAVMHKQEVIAPESSNQNMTTQDTTTQVAKPTLLVPTNQKAWHPAIPEKQTKSWRRHAWRLIRNKHYRLAVEKLRKWLSKASDDAKLNFLYGQALYSLSRSNVNKTLEQFEKSIQLDPHDLELKYQLGWFYVHLNRNNQAANILKQVLKEQPDHQNAQNLLKKIKTFHCCPK